MTTKKKVIGKIGRVIATSIDFICTNALTNRTIEEGKPLSIKSIKVPILILSWDA
jgi:hypothetical protein|tara:strand:- start:361 stop:525 length:165 start_codon:yes stop_codon:yes gene_type:complete